MKQQNNDGNSDGKRFTREEIQEAADYFWRVSDSEGPEYSLGESAIDAQKRISEESGPRPGVYHMFPKDILYE